MLNDHDSGHTQKSSIRDPFRQLRRSVVEITIERNRTVTICPRNVNIRLGKRLTPLARDVLRPADNKRGERGGGAGELV